MSTQKPPTVPKTWPVRKEHLKKFGWTQGCPGCISLAKGTGFQQIAHDDTCRKRIQQGLREEAEDMAIRDKRLKEADLEETGKRQKLEPIAEQPMEMETAEPAAVEGASSSSRGSGEKRKAEGVPEDINRPAEGHGSGRWDQGDGYPGA